MRVPAFLLLFALLAPAAAQTVYRYVTPDGRTIFSDQPVPGAKLQGTVTPPAPPSGPSGAVEGRKPAAPDAPAADNRAQRLRAATQEVEAATQALAQARARLDTGKEPLPGERTGTAGGGSRLNEDYDARQAANQRAVADAEARLQRAVAARNTAR
jgi:Domain of unknown function (DUF4124)